MKGKIRLSKIPKTSSKGKTDLDRVLDAIDIRDELDALGLCRVRDDDTFAPAIEERREAFAKYAEIDQPRRRAEDRQRRRRAKRPSLVSRLATALKAASASGMEVHKVEIDDAGKVAVVGKPEVGSYRDDLDRELEKFEARHGQD